MPIHSGKLYIAQLATQWARDILGHIIPVGVVGISVGGGSGRHVGQHSPLVAGIVSSVLG